MTDEKESKKDALHELGDLVIEESKQCLLEPKYEHMPPGSIDRIREELDQTNARQLKLLNEKKILSAKLLEIDPNSMCNPFIGLDEVRRYVLSSMYRGDRLREYTLAVKRLVEIEVERKRNVKRMEYLNMEILHQAELIS